MSDHYTAPTASADGETADASDINSISTATEAAFDSLEAEVDANASLAVSYSTISQAWAETAEDTEVPGADPGSYSALHWAAKAAESATSAASAVSSASTYASNAATSASNASTYASNANTSASNASTSASNASTSATNAATSASNASTSATDAASSATDAETAQAAAEDAQAAAEAAAATVPTQITVADTADTTCYVGLWESATGDLAPKSDAGITYNASTGILTATGFSGPLTGNVTGDVTGNASTATTLATARTIGGTSFNGSANIVPQTITIAQESADTSCYVGFFTDNTGSLQPKVSGSMTYNSNTGMLTASGFTGPLTGNCSGSSATVTSATQAAITTCANLTTIGTVTSGNVDALVSRPISQMLTDGATSITTGIKACIRIPAALNGYTVTAVAGATTAPSTGSGPISVSLERGRGASLGAVHVWNDILSNDITIDDNEYDSGSAATQPSINGTYAGVQTGDLIRFTIDNAGSGPTAIVTINITLSKV